MKSRIISYLFYFVFWMAGAIYASIEKTSIDQSIKYAFETSFVKTTEVQKPQQILDKVRLTRHLPEVVIYAKKLPEKGMDKAETTVTFNDKTEEGGQDLSEDDRRQLINLELEIEVINKSLSNLTKYLPIAEIDIKAINQPLISEKV